MYICCHCWNIFKFKIYRMPQTIYTISIQIFVLIYHNSDILNNDTILIF